MASTWTGLGGRADKCDFQGPNQDGNYERNVNAGGSLAGLSKDGGRRHDHLVQQWRWISVLPGRVRRQIRNSKTRSAMEKKDPGEWDMDQNRAAEMMFLIKALEKM